MGGPTTGARAAVGHRNLLARQCPRRGQPWPLALTRRNSNPPPPDVLPLPHERRARQLQCPSHGAVVGEARPAARQATAAGAASDAGAASAQPLLDLGLLREVFAPRADGAGAANNSMERRDIE
jgi:hypothetical protein